MGSCVSVNDGGGADAAVSVSEVPEVTGVHDFTIRQYSRSKGIGAGNSVVSQNFTVAGRTWYIRFFPDGFSHEEQGYVSFYLEALHGRRRFSRPALVARFSFTLLTGNGAAVHTVVCSGRQPFKFDRRYHGWGVRKFIARELLEGETLGALHGDSLTVRCNLVVVEKKRRSRSAGPVGVPVPPSCHAEDAARFLLSGDAPFDLEIEVGGATFKAHRMVVAGQSPYFWKLLYGQGKEATSPRLRVQERSPEAFGAVLHYIYHDKLPEEVTTEGENAAAMARELFEAADMYAMGRLKLLCASNLCRFIGDDTAAGIMEMGRTYSCKELERACQNYLIRRGNRVAGGVL